MQRKKIQKNAKKYKKNQKIPKSHPTSHKITSLPADPPPTKPTPNLLHLAPRPRPGGGHCQKRSDAAIQPNVIARPSKMPAAISTTPENIYTRHTKNQPQQTPMRYLHFSHQIYPLQPPNTTPYNNSHFITIYLKKFSARCSCAELADIQPPEPIDGISMMPTLPNKGKQTEHKYLFLGKRIIRGTEKTLSDEDILKAEKTDVVVPRFSHYG